MGCAGRRAEGRFRCVKALEYTSGSRKKFVKNSALGRVFVKFACAKCGCAVDDACDIERYKRNGDAGLLADAYGRDVPDCPIV